WFPDYRGGSGRVATDTARALAERGHEVTVLAPRAEGEPLVLREERLSLHRVLSRTALPDTFTDIVEVGRRARALNRQRFDVLVAHQPTNFTGLLAARLGIPTALVFHASAPLELRLLRRRMPPGPRRLGKTALQPALTLLERLAVAKARRILVLSRFSQGLVEDLHPKHSDRVRVVQGGIDTRFFHPAEEQQAARHALGLPGGVPLLLTARRLDPRMGLEELLRALTLLGDERVTLAIVGRGMLEPALRRLASELGLASRVRFVGTVSDEELRSWYRAADLFVLPTTAYEGFGLATVEALACGTPVLGTPVGATPELLEPLDPRLLAASASPDDLAAGIERALGLTGPALRARCREHATATFDWRAAIVGWEEMLAEAASNPRALAGAGLDAMEAA
ncbi:MAG: glycosyltransferase family 4 protein, partial [Gaiellaceae bacterium]